MLNDLSRYCLCGEEILNDICSEEQIISGCFDVSKNSKKLLLRHLEDIKCGEYDTELRGKGGRLTSVFDLGFDMVNKMALGLLILAIIVLGSAVLILVAGLV